MDTLQPGQNLGPYRIIAQAGQGGMATVYRAYHAAMDRYVAVKVLPSQLAESPEFVSRFQQEARTIAKLEHARILPVYDYGESGGLTYLVMRYLDAGTLKERMSRVPMPLAQVDRLFTQLAEALEYAHQQGVIHRDLKPSNALVDSQNNLFLTDFGIAKLLEGGAQLTTTGAMIGTPAYMSPEQAQGDKVDQRTDIYSLGVILYEMTTGRVPFEAETPLAVVLKQIGSPLPLPSSVMPNFSPAIERVLLKALAKEPNDRYATVTEFLAAWKRALTELDTVQASAPSSAEVQAVTPTRVATPSTAAKAPPLAAPPVSTPVPPPAPKRKIPVAWLIGAGAVVVIGLLAVGVIIFRPRANQNNSTATTAPVSTENFHWQSWAASNFVTVLAVHEGQLYAGGLGSVNVWDLASGERVAQYTTANGLPHASVNAVWVAENGTLWVGTNSGLARRDPDSEEWTIYGVEDGLGSSTVTAITRAGDFLVVGTKYAEPEGGGLNLFSQDNGWQTFPDFPSTSNENALAEGKLSHLVNVVWPMEGELWVGTEVGLGRYNAESGEWTRFTTDDGLPDNNIYSLFTDRDGTLWVGTANSGARFNGTNFESTAQAPQASVFGITQDADGRLYFSGGSGIWRFDPATSDWREFSVYTGDLEVYTLYAALAVEGKLYFGSDGGGPIMYDGESFEAWYSPNTLVNYALGHILPAPDDELWFMQDGGSYPDRFSLSENVWRDYVEPPCGCTPLAYDAQGNLWANEWPNSFHIVSPDGTDTRFGPEQGLLDESYVWSVAFAPDGGAWLGTDTGIAHFNGERVDKIIRAAEGGFATDSVRTVFMASDGSLWLASEPGDSFSGSVSRLKPDGAWEHYTAGNGLSSSFGLASHFVEDANGQLWMGTYGDWAYRFDGNSWEQVTGDLPSPYVLAITLAPDGSLWFATDSGAAQLRSDDWSDFEVDEDELINGVVNDIYVEPNGAVWFATSGGVSRWGP